MRRGCGLRATSDILPASSYFLWSIADRFYQRFYHYSAERYNENDRELLHDSMAGKGFKWLVQQSQNNYGTTHGSWGTVDVGPSKGYIPRRCYFYFTCSMDVHGHLHPARSQRWVYHHWQQLQCLRMAKLFCSWRRNWKGRRDSLYLPLTSLPPYPQSWWLSLEASCFQSLKRMPCRRKGVLRHLSLYGPGHGLQ